VRHQQVQLRTLPYGDNASNTSNARKSQEKPGKARERQGKTGKARALKTPHTNHQESSADYHQSLMWSAGFDRDFDINVSVINVSVGSKGGG